MEIQEQLDELWPRGDTPVDAFLFEHGAVMRAARTALNRRIGISDARLHVLVALFLHGELSQAELQHHLDVDGAAVTRQVKQMESEGLISRRASPSDNRFTLVTLTDEGKDRLREVARKVKEFITQSLEGVSAEDLACVHRVTARVRANLETM
jgi:DNA-binding MarR family transcriptional regulator